MGFWNQEDLVLILASFIDCATLNNVFYLLNDDILYLEKIKQDILYKL